MPKALDDCVKKLMKQGKSESSAYAICTASLGLEKKTKKKTKRKKKK